MYLNAFCIKIDSASNSIQSIGKEGGLSKLPKGSSALLDGRTHADRIPPRTIDFPHPFRCHMCSLKKTSRTQVPPHSHPIVPSSRVEIMPINSVIFNVSPRGNNQLAAGKLLVLVNSIAKSPEEMSGTKLQTAGGEPGATLTTGVHAGTAGNWAYRLPSSHKQSWGFRCSTP